MFKSRSLLLPLLRAYTNTPAPDRLLQIGQRAELTKVLTDKDVTDFAALSLDDNPVHLDEEYAKTTRFKGRIAHGMIAGGLLGAVLGTKLPGPGSIFLRNTLEFSHPLRIGDQVRAQVEVKQVLVKKQGKVVYVFDTWCTNQEGVEIVRGEASVLFQY